MHTDADPAFHVDTADYRRDFAALRAVREPVFVVEQQVPLAEEWDALDPQCFHVLARDTQGRPIGTARLTPERRIGRMAVLPAWRGRGVARAMLEHVLEEARRRGWSEVGLHAQVQAIDFYARAGFQAEGEVFMEAGIAHRSMRRSLTRPSAPPAATEGGETAGHATGLDEAPAHFAVRGPDEGIACAARIVAAARRELRLLSPDLEPAVYGRPELVEALRRHAVDTRGARVLLLVHDAAALSRGAHPLLPLAQRLPSVFQIRVVEEAADRAEGASFLLNDRGDGWFRAQATGQDGEAFLRRPARARRLQQRFDALFERARQATELRALGL